MKTLEKKIQTLKQLKEEIHTLIKLKGYLEAYPGDKPLRMDSCHRIFDKTGDNQLRVDLKALISPSKFLDLVEERLSVIQPEAEQIENMFSMFEKALGNE